MNFTTAVLTNKPIKRESWSDYLTVQACDCQTNPAKRPHAMGGCPEPALMFPDYVDPKLTTADVLAQDWEALGLSEEETQKLTLDIVKSFVTFPRYCNDCDCGKAEGCGP